MTPPARPPAVHAAAAEAKAEIREAPLWYARQQPGLGQAFVSEVRRQIDLIRDLPLGFARVSIKGADIEIRRAVCSRSPYVLFFRRTSDRIEILAVAHTSRLPGYWIDR